MQSFINRLWYGKPSLLNVITALLLLPLSLLFYLLSSCRRLSFRLGFSKAYRLSVPVIVVGNITVGGSGKTPTVIYLIELLRRQGYRPGVISRGYGVDFIGTRLVKIGMSPNEVGDEPAMIVGRTHVPMVIGRDRVAAAQQLLAEAEVDIIISDDGLQHYRLHRDVELLILDGERRFGNGFLLPAGPLREGVWRQKQVDFTIVNGEHCLEREFAMQLLPSAFKPVVSDNLDEFRLESDAVALAGIGNPQRFFDTLSQQGIRVSQHYSFDDHQAFSLNDIESVAADKQVLMTEKDAVKCREFATQNWWYLPVDAKIDARFDQQLLALLQQKKIEQGNNHGV
ncbi:tetraacyldisaccharide 4'-kinase [Shewanella sp. Isolate11]|uniref:tetraacyldisaccharide 4'-kinase n=1 Tax=Shewanella sp. Isolate11 TaxID=2908530 RepID=UPI001EFD7F9D|nr:tetraacyldisaccharide 4'-kinase [Shewanella sp. Isolate11]MCG9696940.1 tetraacyldisaccharide 4'-kinase [Shewanella sp. Isolate11]